MKIPTYQAIARRLQAWNNAQEAGNAPWVPKHELHIREACHAGPSGSGWDKGTQLDFGASTPDKLVFYGSFHHMNEHGFYDGWTEHRITVKPSLAFGFELTISGRDRNEIKDYLSDVFYLWLREETEE